MANNRMYLKCSCGGLFYLGKRMGDGYYSLDHFTLEYESPPNYDHRS